MRPPESTEPPTQPSRLLPTVAAAVIGLGCILRLWQFATVPSLWVDELAVVRNIVHLPPARLLLSPLEWGQMVPTGFLAVGAMLSAAVPAEDWVFRVVPFVSSFATLPVIYVLSRRMLGPWPALLVTGMVALSPPLIGLGTVAKQYASDVFVSAVLMYGASKVLSGDVREPRALAWMGTLGGVLLFFSFPGILVAFVLTVGVSASWVLERRTRWMTRILGLGVPLGVSAGIATVIALRTRSPETATFLSSYWAAGFPESVSAFPAWLWTQLAVVFEVGFITPYPQSGLARLSPHLLLAVSSLGLATLIVRERRMAIVTLAPLVAAVLAAVASVYPLAHRTSVFLVPTLALSAVAGSMVLGRVVKSVFRPAALVVGAFPLLVVSAALLRAPPPYLIEHTRPLIQSVAEEWEPEDVLYSYYAANQAVDYYGTRFGIRDWVPGVCARGNPRAYLRQLDALRGHARVWVVFSHALPELHEAETILGYLRMIGSEKEALLSHLDRFHTAAYLFDLSDPARLGRANADDYVLDATATAASRRVCGRGPASTWKSPGS